MTARYSGGTLNIESLSVELSGQRLLDDISLDLPAGSTTAVVGPSGSGKTTLLRSIAGFLIPRSGEIRLDGTDITRLSVHRRSIGLVAQDGALFPHLSVARNIAFGLDNGSLDRRQRKRRVAELLELVSLPQDFGRRRPDQLSGGQRQRVALARALAPAPQVILLDEPFSALDAGLREKTRKAVQEVLRSTGTTALLVTHDQDEALSFADQVAVLTAGMIRQAGEPQSIYSHPADLETAQFLGDAVILGATVTAGMATCALGRVPLRGSESGGTRGVEGQAQVMLRPEQIEVVPAGKGTPAEVLEADYFGHDTTVTMRVHGEEGTIRVRQLNVVPPVAGETVGLVVKGTAAAYPAGR